MSLVQIARKGDHAWCAVDTRITGTVLDNAAQDTEASKMVLIPHSGCVLASRGSVPAFAALCAAALADPRAHDFDSLTECIPAFVHGLSQNWPASTRPDFQLFVIGWSSRSGQMEVALYEIDIRRDTIANRQVPDTVVAPEYVPDADFELGGFDTDAKRLAVARMQLKRMEELDPENVTGGRLLVAEITRERICIRDAGPIAEPDQL